MKIYFLRINWLPGLPHGAGGKGLEVTPTVPRIASNTVEHKAMIKPAPETLHHEPVF